MRGRNRSITTISMSTTTRLLLLSTSSILLVLSSMTEALVVQEQTLDDITERRMSIDILNSILNTEMESELSVYSANTAKDIWKRATWLEWDRLLKESEDGSSQIAVLMCSTQPDSSGIERLRAMHEVLVEAGVTGEAVLNDENVQIAYNHEEMTCAFVRMQVTVALNAALTGHDWLLVQPLVSMSKLIGGSVFNIGFQFDDIEGFFNNNNDDNDNDDNNNNRKLRNLQNQNEPQPPQPPPRNTTLPPKINILLCRGAVTQEDIDNIAVDVAENQGREIKELLSRRTTDGGSYVKEVIFGVLHNATADHEDNDGSTITASSRRKFWTEVFENAVDATDEICDAMVEQLEIQFDPDLLVLTITLPMTIKQEEELNVAPTPAPTDPSVESSINAVLGRALNKASKWCGLTMLAGITLSDKVCMVEVEPRMSIANVQSSWLMQSGVRDQWQFFEEGLDGRGQVVAVSDTGIDVENCYFRDAAGSFSLNGDVDMSRRKVVQYIPFVDRSDYQFGHGTHVSGTVAGKKSQDGLTESNGFADGVARGAKLAFIDIGFPDGALSVPVPVTSLLETGIPAGAKIHSASWGSESNDYGFNSRSFDDYIWRNDNFLIMVAAGNSGRNNAFNTVGDPATAKNIISVGAGHSDNPDLSFGMLGPSYVADFSSKGPTADGRTKPDIIAPGKFILSAGAQPLKPGSCDPPVYPSPGGADEGVLSIAGTSMATPGVSGVAAIIRQYFEEGWYPDGVKNESRSYSPSGAGVKAVILNGGQPMTGVDNGRAGVYPTTMYDNITNFGRVSMINSLYLPGKTNVDLQLWDRQIVGFGETQTFNITIDKSRGCTAAEMSVTLVWSDPPASVGCRRCLVNDLDLILERVSDGAQFYPNGRAYPDRTNNAERVRVEVNDKDQFLARVTGTNLVTDSQHYAIAAAGCFGAVANTLDMSNSPFDPNNQKTRNTIIGVVVGVGGAALIAAAVISILQKRRSGGGQY